MNHYFLFWMVPTSSDDQTYDVLLSLSMNERTRQAKPDCSSHTPARAVQNANYVARMENRTEKKLIKSRDYYFCTLRTQCSTVLYVILELLENKACYYLFYANMLSLRRTKLPYRTTSYYAKEYETSICKKRWNKKREVILMYSCARFSK